MVTGNYVEWFKKLGDSVELVENKPSPRYIKSHLPWDLLPKQIHEKKPKVIYIFFLLNFYLVKIIFITKHRLAID